MQWTDWTVRFPELRPIESVPLLWSVKGCGFRLYGRRDHDEETKSYVETYALCVLGIPIWNLSSYLFAEFPYGYDVVGRLPLSRPARTGNSVLLTMILLVAVGLPLGLGLWALNRAMHNLLPNFDPALMPDLARLATIGKPDEFARQRLARADELLAAGKAAESARLCRQVAQLPGTPPDQVAAAVQRVRGLVELPAATVAVSEQAGVFQVAVALHQAGRWSGPPEALYREGMAQVNQRASTDAAGALEILEAVAPLASPGGDLNEARRSLLERIVATHPDDPALVSRLAAVHEAAGRDERVFALLEPLRERLGTTDGARILGLADVRCGRIEPALALLRPYVHSHLKALQTAEQALMSANQTAPKRNMDRLLASRSPVASKSSETDPVDRTLNYFEDLYAGDPEIEGARQRRSDESSVVPVALELGTILLKHARDQPDRHAREREIDEAETLFLEAVRLGSEGRLSVDLFLRPEKNDPNTDRLNLAEVRYWEGKPREGRALIDEVLAARKRDPGMLLRVSRLLRRVGSSDEARALSEEAYTSWSNRGNSDLRRGGMNAAAVHRSLMGLDSDEQIFWLNRANPADPEVKVLMSSDLADQAIARGDDDSAIAHCREALTLYDAFPQGSATLNNSALILFRLSRLTGDRAAFDRGFARIEKAHTLEPIDSLESINLAEFVREAALRDIIGPAIDLLLLKESARLDDLAFLYHDRSGREGFAHRVGAHSGINRLIALLEKSLLLAPRNGHLYRALDELYAYRGETEKQRGLAQRLERIDLDQSDEIARAKSIYAGGRIEQRRTAAAAAIRRAETTLKAARARNRDVTFAVAATRLASARMSGHAAGLETDADGIVSLAEEAHASAPSYQTRNVLVYALFFRAGRRLIKTQTAYARMSEKTRSSITDSERIAVALNGNDPLRTAARQDADVRRAVGLIREANHYDSAHNSNPWTWSLVRAFDPKEADSMAQTYLKDESAQLSRVIRSKLEPASASAALSLYWAAEMVGPSAGGPDILRAYAARGVPLPIDSP